MLERKKKLKELKVTLGMIIDKIKAQIELERRLQQKIIEFIINFCHILNPNQIRFLMQLYKDSVRREVCCEKELKDNRLDEKYQLICDELKRWSRLFSFKFKIQIVFPFRLEIFYDSDPPELVHSKNSLS